MQSTAPHTGSRLDPSDRGPVALPAGGFLRLPLMFVALWALSRYSFPLFHSVVELYSIVISVSVFVIAYNARRLVDHHYLLFAGIGFLFFAVLDVPHLFAYPGIALFPGFGGDLAVQAFIAQRFMLAGTFLISPLYLRRRLPVRTTLIGFSAVTLLALLMMFVWRDFPVMWVAGQGLTPLKRISEVLLIATFGGAIVMSIRERSRFDPDVLRLLVTALASFAASEVAFSLYATPFSTPILIGHLLQVAGFYFTYRAVLVTALVNPFAVLFRELADRESSLSALNARLSAVAEIGDEAIATLDVGPLGARLLERLVKVMNADTGVLYLAEGTALRPAATIGPRAWDAAVPIGQGFAGEVAATGVPAARTLAAETPQGAPGEQPVSGRRCELAAPLKAGDALLGVVLLAREECPNQAEDVRLLDILADRLALAIRNAQLYESERHVAAVLQESLLSMPDRVDGVRLERAYHSASQAARVGGDFYDAFEVVPQRVALVIGDVSGKGIEAAVLTSLVRDTLRAHAAEGDKGPAEVVRLTSRVIERASDSATFVTLFLGILDPLADTLTYCNAGHPTVFIVRPAGDVSALPSNSPLAGAFPDTTFEEDEVRFAMGDMLVLYTDGVVEARRDGELYGEARLRRLLDRSRGSAPKAVIGRLIEDVVGFTGGGLSDDLAVLVAQRNETPATADAPRVVPMEVEAGDLPRATALSADAPMPDGPSDQAPPTGRA